MAEKTKVFLKKLSYNEKETFPHQIVNNKFIIDYKDEIIDFAARLDTDFYSIGNEILHLDNYSEIQGAETLKLTSTGRFFPEGEVLKIR